MNKERRRNRLNATNTLNGYLNKVVPLIHERLAKGYKLKQDGNLFKKDKTDVDKILNENKPINTIRAYLNPLANTTWLVTDIHYHEEKDCHYVVYIKDDVFLFRNITETGLGQLVNVPYSVRSTYKEHDVEGAHSELVTLDTKIHSLKCQRDIIKSKYRNFIR